MDFITLALETDPRHILRKLDQILTDDDGYDPTHTGDAAAAIYSSVQNEDAMSSARAPLMSKTAEAELYLLATNFLLYVALVIITTIVAKIYFPEFLERDTSAVTPRSFKYRVATQESEDFYASDDEEGSDEEKELLNSDDSTGAGRKGGDRPHDSRRSYDFMEPNESLSKVQVLRRLIFCSLMLNVTFVMWGLLQVSLSLPLLLGRGFFLNVTNPFSRSGANADKAISALCWRVLYLFLCPCLYKPILDVGHVGYADAIPETTKQSNHCNL